MSRESDVPSQQNAVPGVPGNSVVKDLMRVYENLTQSSTPQGGAEGRPHHREAQQHSAADHEHQRPLAPQHPPPHHPHQPYHPPENYAIQHPPGYPVQGHVPSHHPPPQPHLGGPPPQYYGDPAYSSQPGYMVPPPPEHQQPYAHLAPGQHMHAPTPNPQLSHDDDDDENDSECQSETSGRVRRKRRGSDIDSSRGSSRGGGGSRSRKKSKSTDGRWSKRFTWPEDLHRDFVSAIFDVGLKHSSPATILEHMPKQEELTTERIKSHLQKYRMHRVKSKKEFISSYEASLRKGGKPEPGTKALSGPEVAAHLTVSSMKEDGSDHVKLEHVKLENKMLPPQEDKPQPSPEKPSEQQKTNDLLMLPKLTEAEKDSPVGSAMGYLLGLFFSLKQQLMVQRSLEEKANAAKSKPKSPVEDVFKSFVDGGAPAAAPAEQQQHEVPQNITSGAAAAKPPANLPSVRTNIEENSMMKREMQSQMALQNKMRAMKQQELNKYKNVCGHDSEDGGGKEKSLPSESQADFPGEEAIHHAAGIQGAGETAAGNDVAVGNRPRELSIGGSDEFWNTDVVDEQLFEFLMNN